MKLATLFLTFLLFTGTAVAQLVPNYPAAEYYLINNSNVGRQGLRVDTAPNNNYGIAIMGHAGSATSTGGYFSNTSGGQALLTLGKVNMNLYDGQSLILSHTRTHLRLIAGPPGDNTGHGVILGTDGNYFAIGVTARDDALGPVQKYLVIFDLATGKVVQQ